MDPEIPWRTYVNRSGRRFKIFERNTHLIIINHMPLDEDEPSSKIRTHMRRCDRVQRFFQDCTDAVVHTIRMNPGDDHDDFDNRFDEIIEGLGLGDLIIPYYHGLAGNNGKRYMWNFETIPQVYIDAYDLVSRINKTEVDCLFILDCFVPTRFRAKWKRDNGNTEIMARGHPSQDQNGRILGGDEDFTEVMITEMETIFRKNRGQETSVKAPRSIPQLMKGDQHIASNPVRVWVQRPEKGKYNIIKRMVTWPKDVRGPVEWVLRQDPKRNEDGDDEDDEGGDVDEEESDEPPDDADLSDHNEERKIRFFAMRIQGPKPPGAGSDDEDEGFDEPDTTPHNSSDDSTEDSSHHSSAAAGDDDEQAPPADEDTGMSEPHYPPSTGANDRKSTLFVQQGPYWTG